MKKTFIALLLLFTATVKIPFEGNKEYKNVVAIDPYQYYYKLTLTDEKTVFVPIMWTVIEEK